MKLFDSMARLEFVDGKTKGTLCAPGMYAKDGEYVEFHGSCDCSGPVSFLCTVFWSLDFLVSIII